jgi:5-methylthioadenosine/S-adenosylhomocysteine deaminase
MTMSLDRRDFLRISALGGAAATAGLTPAQTAEAATTNDTPTRPRILLRGGYILTMDPALGDLRGDVVIDNVMFAAVVKNLSA